MVKGVYKPRKPKGSALYQCVSKHFAEFESVYPERYQERFGLYRPVIRKVMENLLGCGDLARGFPRVLCEPCRHGDPPVRVRPNAQAAVGAVDQAGL
jgi:hypothetical protein